MHTPVITRPHPVDAEGVQKLYRFANGYGASVIRFNSVYGNSYGYSDGKWELAVVEFHGDGIYDFNISYDTPITADVVGYLTEDEVEKTLDRIQRLPALNSAPA